MEILSHRLLRADLASDRIRALESAISRQPTDQPLLVVAPTPRAGSQMLRRAAAKRPVMGWERVTPLQLVARLAAPILAAQGLGLASGLAKEAIAARTVYRLGHGGQLGRFARVQDRPGFPRALSRTFSEFAQAGVRADRVAGDLGVVYRAFCEALRAARLADRADMLAAAVTRLESGAHPFRGAAVFLLDVPIDSVASARLAKALTLHARGFSIAVPTADSDAQHHLCAVFGEAFKDLETDPAPNALGRLQRQLFRDVTTRGESDASVQIFSAPGETREAVEVARRLRHAAADGVRFDRMAVLTHAPLRYRSALSEAMRRADIPSYFTRGTLRPDPAGRALLALLRCREEDLSARAFSEYLSLGQVPDLDEDGAVRTVEPEWSAPDEWDEEDAQFTDDPEEEPLVADPDDPAVGGTLRAPWRWERLLVDAAVIGGRDRWARRLDGLSHAITSELHEHTLEPERMEALQRRAADLSNLRRFALPVLQRLIDLETNVNWGRWREQLSTLAKAALRTPERVLSVLDELAPMGPVGPVSLAEVQLVLSERLGNVLERPTGRPDGKVYIASIEEVRGLSFERVFVLGLAERSFPKKVIEDPIALDSLRQGLAEELPTTEQRIGWERAALRIAVGAAQRQCCISYPRLDTERSRPRVPSFYALEVVRAIEGELPSFEALAARADGSLNSRPGWPAPLEPSDAIDGAEYDLAVLADLLTRRDAEPSGAARYLLLANPHLARALRSRWMRWDESRWTPADGMMKPDADVLESLAEQSLAVRPFSVTSLENFAVCPYRFFLRALVGLYPQETPSPVEVLDPRHRGRFLHEAQFLTLGRLRQEDLLPLKPSGLERARVIVGSVVQSLRARYKEELAPAIDRVFDDAIDAADGDLREWLVRLAEGDAWVPTRFELGFGIEAREGNDPSSRPEPVELPEGVLLRGAIDLVERQGQSLRATDYKSGAVVAPEGVRVGGGKVLQPALYARVLEVLFPDHDVVGGRLYYPTLRGGFAERRVPLNDHVREQVHRLLNVVNASIVSGKLPADPEPDACTKCDYISVCGPSEERRTRRKRTLAELASLRREP